MKNHESMPLNTPLRDLLQRIPRRPFGVYPTPLQHATQLRQAVGGPDIWIKRDDLIGFGLGGNKIRGLEVIIADALAKGADTLVTGAGVQSNHVRATAAAAAYCGLNCVAVYWGTPPAVVDGNYRVTKMLGAQVRFTGDAERRSVDGAIETIAAELRRDGKHSYPIPRGGACTLGALGHLYAVQELYEQCAALAIAPQTIVLAGGSGGTYAGWLLGIRILGLPWRLSCFSVSRPAAELSAQVANLATSAAKWLGLNLSFCAEEIPVCDGFIGAGYGIPSAEGAAAITIVSRSEALLLDPTYTGKAMAGYLHEVRQGRYAQDGCAVFLHSGGEPAFYAGDGRWLGE
ncbi:MAG: 1-aminocyclopropane-1-carboxylate deaminase/D-cysteine desulfhydrase [Gammaproteobacteria bacterium]